jgi:hypothetical protein
MSDSWARLRIWWGIFQCRAISRPKQPKFRFSAAVAETVAARQTPAAKRPVIRLRYRSSQKEDWIIRKQLYRPWLKPMTLFDEFWSTLDHFKIRWSRLYSNQQPPSPNPFLLNSKPQKGLNSESQNREHTPDVSLHEQNSGSLINLEIIEFPVPLWMRNTLHRAVATDSLTRQLILSAFCKLTGIPNAHIFVNQSNQILIPTINGIRNSRWGRILFLEVSLPPMVWIPRILYTSKTQIKMSLYLYLMGSKMISRDFQAMLKLCIPFPWMVP